jgi:hypothetical protein
VNGSAPVTEIVAGEVRVTRHGLAAYLGLSVFVLSLSVACWILAHAVRVAWAR